MSEDKIMDMLSDRDPEGLRALMQLCGPLIKYVISPILPDYHDMEECISEISMKIWEKSDSFDREKGSLRSWITAIARNAAINMAKQKNHRGQPQEIPEDTPSASPTPEEALLKKERTEALRRAIAKLTPEECSLFYRKYYYMQKTEQIASETGMTVRAAEGRLYRLRKKLRDILGGDING